MAVPVDVAAEHAMQIMAEEKSTNDRDVPWPSFDMTQSVVGR